jgi:excisionase family DNA binding protein
MTHVRQSHPPGLSIDAAAQLLGCAPRTVRHWLQIGRLQGIKVGQRTWMVLLPPEAMAAPATAVGAAAQCAAEVPAVVRQRLRDVGTQLIAVGNRVAQAIPRAGALFLTWRTPRSLRVTLAIGRVSPTQRWAPHALGVELPFWLDERARWRQVPPLLRRYDTLRACCRPWLLRLPGVGAAVLAELAMLEAAVVALGEADA